MSVEASILSAISFNDLAKLIGDHVLVGVLDRTLPGLLQLLELLLIPARRLVTFCNVGCVGRLHFCQCDFLGWIVLGADLRSP